MAVINVPVYKTEAGVHNAAPGVATDFNTHALVSGVLTPKKVREVLVKYIASAWVIQSVFSTGTVAVIETTNPATSQTAFLKYPINDFLISQGCCAENDG